MASTQISSRPNGTAGAIARMGIPVERLNKVNQSLENEIGILELQNKVIKYETMARKQGIVAAEENRRAERQAAMGALDAVPAQPGV